MTITLKCHANCDDVFLAWKTDADITDCLGFAIEIKDSNGNIEPLHNLKGFASDHPQTGQTQPSTVWPFQTYTWTDHSVLVDSEVSFKITAMTGQPGSLTRGADSGWSPVIKLDPAAGNNTRAFFNRGVILSQFVSRYAANNQISGIKELKANLTANVDGPLMQFLTGELGKALRGMLQGVKDDDSMELYCALFELDLDDLIDDLIDIGDRAHVLLANGSVTKAGGDENKNAAAELEGHVDLHRRMTAPHGLAHNKFAVLTKNGKPFAVFTGSTNWTMTGLHTQINNGIAIEDATLAQAYYDHWQAMADAGDSFTADLKSGNAKAHGPFSINSDNDAVLWFTPTNVDAAHKSIGGADVQELIALVNDAKDGILFINFMPGQEPLDSILKRQEGGLYVRGVVSTLPDGSKANPSPTFQIMNNEGYKEYAHDVVQPQGTGAVGDFLAEFTRQQFLSGMGFAITHSKIIVIDPFGAEPVVVTGSHNLSASASERNDENLLIIRNNPDLARAYAVNCMAVYQHYRWPAVQHDAKQGDTDAGYLVTSDAWQQGRENNPDMKSDLAFWA
jgi:phosphatidylserine/phosphatidylglycerophosphate/cardiolipin synthase-like enzyme